MSNPFVSAHEAREIDLVDYLNSLGHQPQKIRGEDYWYQSPLRTERTPSFKVNRKLNLWYDHGIGKGGTIIDFGMLYFNCSVKEALQHLQARSTATIASSFFHQPLPGQNSLHSQQTFAGEKKENLSNKNFHFAGAFTAG